jgi:hypothetical protein
VVGKAEVLPGKVNPRFVVTNLPLSRTGARWLYETFYCIWGEMENRIHKLKAPTRADQAAVPVRLEVHASQLPDRDRSRQWRARAAVMEVRVRVLKMVLRPNFLLLRHGALAPR